MGNKYNPNQLNDIELNALKRLHDDLDSGKKEGGISDLLGVLVVWGGLFLFVKLITWLISLSDIWGYLFLIIAIGLIPLGVICDIRARKYNRKFHEDKMKYIYEIDSDAEDFQIIYEDICKNNKKELSNKHYYRNKTIKEFAERTNNSNLCLAYIENSYKSFNSKCLNFDKNDYTSYKTVDYFEGNALSNIPIQLATIKGYTYNTTSHNSRSLTFSGGFIVIAQNTNANIKVMKLSLLHILTSDNILLNLSKEDFDKCRELYKADLGKENEVNLTVDNDRFNRFFDVYTDNLEIANKFLTPELLEFIIDFRIKYGIKFEIIFKDKIYIKFYTEDMFNIKEMLSEEGDKVSAAQYYLMTKFAKELTEKLN